MTAEELRLFILRSFGKKTQTTEEKPSTEYVTI